MWASGKIPCEKKTTSVWIQNISFYVHVYHSTIGRTIALAFCHLTCLPVLKLIPSHQRSSASFWNVNSLKWKSIWDLYLDFKQEENQIKILWGEDPQWYLWCSTNWERHQSIKICIRRSKVWDDTEIGWRKKNRKSTKQNCSKPLL